MGVNGLLKYILGTPSAREKVQLKEFAQAHLKKTGKTPELLCDFTPVLKWLLSSYDYTMMQRELETPYCLLHGGVLKHYSDRVLSFVRTIQSLGLSVVFCVESNTVSEKEMEVLYDAYTNECSKKVQEVCHALRICTSNHEMTQIEWECREGVASHVIFTLEFSNEVQMMYCSGSVLSKAITYMQANKHVCGILSDDTSYAIASGCGLFLIDLFQLDVHQPNPILPSLDPEQDLSCEVVWSTWLAASLDLSRQQLADLAILSGDRYTKYLNSTLHLPRFLGVTDMSVVQLAEWLHTQDTPLLAIPNLEDFLQSNPSYRKAIELSHHTYLNGGHQSTKSEDLLKDLPSLEEIVSRGGVLSPQMVSAVSSGMYWRQVLMEPQISNCPRFSDVTFIIRTYVYALLGLSQVYEYGFITSTTSPAQIPVEVVLNNVDTTLLSTNERLGILHHLVTCPQIIDNPNILHTVMEVGMDKAQGVKSDIPVSDILLFASLVFMRDSNLRITPTPNILLCELDALLTTVLCSLANLPPLKVTHIPPPKGVTVASWFSHVLDQVYWLAACLGLSRNLPPPGELFTAHQYVLFHLASNLGEDFSEDALPSICSEIKQVCSIYQEIWELEPVVDLRVEMLKSAPTSLPCIADLFRASVDAISSCSSLQEKVSELKYPSFPSPVPPCSVPPPTSSLPVGKAKFQLDLDDLSSGDSALSLIREELSFSQERGATEENQFFSSQSLSGHLSPFEAQGVESLEEEVELEEEDIDSVFEEEWNEAEGGGTVPGASASRTDNSSESVEITDQKSVSLPTTRAAKKASKKKAPPEPELPIMAHRSWILELVHAHTVVCIEGETGCGKSTKVPQFILDESLAQGQAAGVCRILVTQPRRVAAMKLAERVALERGERLGTTVGYCVGGDHHRAAQTVLTYCTIGYLLQVIVSQIVSVAKPEVCDPKS